VQIQDRLGLLSLTAIGAGNLAIASTIRAFPKEKTIVTSERAKGMYGMAPYFFSKVPRRPGPHAPTPPRRRPGCPPRAAPRVLIQREPCPPCYPKQVVAEAPVSAAVSALGGAALYPLVGLNPAPGKFARFLLTVCLEGLASGALGLFLGAVAPTTDTALALFPPFLVLMIIFNGFNIAEESAPKALRWLPKVSFIRWASEGLAVNEFTGLRFSCAGARGPCCETGEQALERVSMGSSTVRSAAIAQTRLLGALYGATFCVLQRNKPRYLSVKPAAGGSLGGS
jgi:hypothetical protein